MLGNSLIARLGGVNAAAFAQFQVPLSGDLATIAGAWVGAWAYVDSQRVGYMAVPVGQGDIAGVGVDWKRDPSTSDTAWLLQATWSINQLTGDDDASGIDDANAVTTLAEVVKRCGGGRVFWRQSVTIRVLSSVAEFVLDYVLLDERLTLTVLDVPTVTLLTGTIATFAASAGNVPRKLTATGVLDWATAGPGGSSLLRKRIRFTAGASVGAICWILKINPEASGNATVRVTDPRFPLTEIAATPAALDAFVVEELNRIGLFDVTFGGYLYPRSLPAAFALSASSFASAQTYLRGFSPADTGAKVHSSYLDGNIFCTPANVPSRIVVVTSLLATPEFAGYGSVSNGYVPFPGATFLLVGGVSAQSGNDTYQGVRPSIRSPYFLLFGTVFSCDSPAAGMTINQGVTVVGGLVSGAGNTSFGLEVAVGGRYLYATKPTIAGTTADLRLNGAALNVPWAAVPWNDGQGSGKAVALVAANQAVVPVGYLAASQSIVVSHNTPAGVGSPGVLNVADADRTTTQFGVRSSLATDAGTFDWSVSPLGFGQVVRLQ